MPGIDGRLLGTLAVLMLLLQVVCWLLAKGLGLKLERIAVLCGWLAPLVMLAPWLAGGELLAPSDILDNPHVVKVVADDQGRAMYFSRAPIPFLRDRADAAVQRSLVYQHIGVYAYSMDLLLRWSSIPISPLERIERLEQLRALSAGVSIGVALLDEPVRPGIDTEADLDRANQEWTAFTTG